MLEKDFTEVYHVINHMEDEDVKKISSNFIEMIQDNMDKSYDFVYDENKKVNEQNLSENSRVIISIMYLKYLACEDEKTRYYEKILEDKKKQEVKFYNKNIFHAEKSKLEKEIYDVMNYDNSNLEISKIEINWYEKIFKNIKNFLKKFFDKNRG